MSIMCIICHDGVKEVLENHGQPEGAARGVRTLTLQCGHRFHQSCVEGWFHRYGPIAVEQCPSCGEDSALSAGTIIWLSRDEESEDDVPVLRLRLRNTRADLRNTSAKLWNTRLELELMNEFVGENEESEDDVLALRLRFRNINDKLRNTEAELWNTNDELSETSTELKRSKYLDEQIATKLKKKVETLEASLAELTKKWQTMKGCLIIFIFWFLSLLCIWICFGW